MILFLQHWKFKSIQHRIGFRLAGYLGTGIVADLVTLSKDHTRNTMPTGTIMILYLRIGNLKNYPIRRHRPMKPIYGSTPPGMCNVKRDALSIFCSGSRPALQGGRPALRSSPQYPAQAITYRESRSCTDYCCLACDSEYEWYKLEGKGKNL